MKRDKRFLKKMFPSGQKAAVFKCWDCEIELCVPPNMVERVASGQVRCTNPNCPGQKKGGGKYKRK